MGGQLHKCHVGLLLAAALVLPGCFGEILDTTTSTKMGFVCQSLVGANPIVVRIYGESPAGIGITHGLEASPGENRFVEALQVALNRSDVSLEMGIDEPPDANDRDDVASWAADHSFRSNRRVIVNVVWVDDVGDGNHTGREFAPGSFFLSRDATLHAADRLAATPDQIGGALMMHHAAHALGVVNDGVPVQNPAIQEREHPAKHEPSPASVMHVGLEDARTMAWHGPYQYSEALLEDWAAARTGVCV